MRLRRYGFTAYAVFASLLWIGILVAGDTLAASAPGRAYIAITRLVIIPLYVIQTLLVMVVIALRGGPPTSPEPVVGALLGIIEWVLSVIPFVLIDKWRARRLG